MRNLKAVPCMYVTLLLLLPLWLVVTYTHCKRSCGLPSCRYLFRIICNVFSLCLRFSVSCARRTSHITIIRAKAAAATYQTGHSPKNNTRFRFSYRFVAVFRPSPREIDRPIRRREFRQISKLLPFTSRLLNK